MHCPDRVKMFKYGVEFLYTVQAESNLKIIAVCNFELP